MVYSYYSIQKRGMFIMYSFNSRVRFSELNHQKGVLSCSSIINYFQDCSTFQSEDLNIGLSYLQDENRVWLLNSWQLEIINSAKLGDYLTIGTWAYDFKGFYGYRNFIMQNNAKEPFAVANSLWIYLDTETGKPVKIPPNHGGYALEPPYPMEHANRKIEIPENIVPYPSFSVIKANIDSYHHVNNGQYVKMAEEFLPDDFFIKSMRVEYKMQAKLGVTIIPLVAIESDHITVVIADSKQKAYAIIEFHGQRL